MNIVDAVKQLFKDHKDGENKNLMIICTPSVGSTTLASKLPTTHFNILELHDSMDKTEEVLEFFKSEESDKRNVVFAPSSCPLRVSYDDGIKMAVYKKIDYEKMISGIDNEIAKFINTEDPNGRKVTPDLIEEKIDKVEYQLLEDSLLTICIITMKNEFQFVGTSTCADPKIFTKEKGEQVAYQKAFDQIFPMEGYLLKEKLYLETLAKKK